MDSMPCCCMYECYTSLSQRLLFIVNFKEVKSHLDNPFSLNMHRVGRSFSLSTGLLSHSPGKHHIINDQKGMGNEPSRRCERA